VIGVTVNEGLLARNIKLKLDRKNAPYVLTKPLHSSQEVIHKDKDGITINIKVVPNYELERLLLGFGPSLEILSPPSLRKRMKELIGKALKLYESD